MPVLCALLVMVRVPEEVPVEVVLAEVEPAVVPFASALLLSLEEEEEVLEVERDDVDVEVVVASASPLK